MTTFPFTAYKVETRHSEKEVRIEGEARLCKSCGEPCGHKGPNTIKTEPHTYNYAQDLLVVGENETEWFVQLERSRDTDYGESTWVDIEAFDKKELYLNREDAEREASANETTN